MRPNCCCWLPIPKVNDLTQLWMSFYCLNMADALERVLFTYEIQFFAYTDELTSCQPS